MRRAAHLLPRPARCCSSTSSVMASSSHAVQGVAGGALVGEQEALVAHVGGDHEARSQDAHVAGVQRDERLVLDHALQGRERAAVADVLEAQEPVDAEHQVGAALVAAQHLDEQLPGRPRRRRSRGWSCARRRRRGPAAPGARRPGPWPRRRRGPRGRLLGAPKTSSTAEPPTTPRPGPGRCPAARLAAGDRAEDRPRDDHGPAGAPPGAADPRRAQDDRRRPCWRRRSSRSRRWRRPRSASRGGGRRRAVRGVPEAASRRARPGRDARSCANRAAATSITNSRNLRRHSDDQADAGGDERGDALEEQVEDASRRLRAGRRRRSIRSRSKPTSVLDAPAANSRPRSTSSTPTMRWSTSDGVRTCLSAGGSSTTVVTGSERRRRRPPPVPAHRVGDRPQDEDDDGDDRVRRGVHGDRHGAHGHALCTPASGPPGADVAGSLGSSAALSRSCPVVM